MAGRRVVIFDFDGTLTSGLEPVRSYAGEVVEAIPQERREQYLLHIDRALAEDPYGIAAGALDGFDLVRKVAEAHRVDPELLQRAYIRSREHLADPSLVLQTPKGLEDFCERLDAHLIIATNSPDIGIREQLERWSMADTFDEILTGIGKPDGLRAVIKRFLVERSAQEIAAVGDIVVNDIAPARELGCTTALVTHGRPVQDLSATFISESLEGLYEPLIAWSHSTGPDTMDFTGQATRPQLNNRP